MSLEEGNLGPELDLRGLDMSIRRRDNGGDGAGVGAAGNGVEEEELPTYKAKEDGPPPEYCVHDTGFVAVRRDLGDRMGGDGMIVAEAITLPALDGERNGRSQGQ